MSKSRTTSGRGASGGREVHLGRLAGAQGLESLCPLGLQRLRLLVGLAPVARAVRAAYVQSRWTWGFKYFGTRKPKWSILESGHFNTPGKRVNSVLATRDDYTATTLRRLKPAPYFTRKPDVTRGCNLSDATPWE